MATLIFDTLAYTKKLRAVGFTEQQAEVQAETFVELIEEKLATKQDILDLKNDIATLERDLRRDFKKDMSDLSFKLTLRLGSMMTIGFTILAAIIKL